MDPSVRAAVTVSPPSPCYVCRKHNFGSRQKFAVGPDEILSANQGFTEMLFAGWVCREHTYGKLFAVSIATFAVCPRPTANGQFPVVINCQYIIQSRSDLYKYKYKAKKRCSYTLKTSIKP